MIINGLLHLIGMEPSIHSVVYLSVVMHTHHLHMVTYQYLITSQEEEQTFNSMVLVLVVFHLTGMERVTFTLVLTTLPIAHLVCCIQVMDIFRLLVLVPSLEYMLHTLDLEDFMDSMVQSNLLWLHLLHLEILYFLVQQVFSLQFVIKDLVLYQHSLVLQNLSHSVQTKSRCSSHSKAEDFQKKLLSGRSAVESLLYLEQVSKQLHLSKPSKVWLHFLVLQEFPLLLYMLVLEIFPLYQVQQKQLPSIQKILQLYSILLDLVFRELHTHQQQMDHFLSLVLLEIHYLHMQNLVLVLSPQVAMDISVYLLVLLEKVLYSPVDLVEKQERSNYHQCERHISSSVVQQSRELHSILQKMVLMYYLLDLDQRDTYQTGMVLVRYQSTVRV